MRTDLSAASAAASAAARELSARLGPDRVADSGPGYDEAVRLWNGAVGRRPALVARCATPADVHAAVRAARDHGLPLSVRGGGHDWAGRALRDGGLVVDLSRMRQVSVDALARVATVQGGATAGEVVAAAAPHELSAATGTVGAVGLAGLTLGGGYGPLGGRLGLALDNLLGAEVVLADGRLVTADARHEPELYWALRGGGGNFGVVTSLRIRLHPVGRLLTGQILFPWSQAADVLGGLDAALTGAPDELTVQSGVLPGPAVVLVPTWCGDPAEGERAVEALRRLGEPLVAQVGPMTHAELPALFDGHVVAGGHYAIRTRTVAALTPDVVRALLAAGSTLTSPLSGITIHPFHGAAARVPADATAFGLRQDHFVVEIVSAWTPEAEQGVRGEHGHDGSRHRAWADSVSTALAPAALPGGYVNLLGPDAHDQIAHAYGPNTARLLAAKRHYDPDAIFSGTPLPAPPQALG